LYVRIHVGAIKTKGRRTTSHRASCRHTALW